MKLKYFFILCPLILAFNGCLYLPMPQHSILAGRGMIKSSDIQDLKIGSTSMEEILLMFGEPDITLEQQSVFSYGWTRVQGYLIFGAGYTGEIAPIGKTTLLLFEFDTQNLLKRFEYLSVGIFNTDMETAIKWASEEDP